MKTPRAESVRGRITIRPIEDRLAAQQFLMQHVKAGGQPSLLPPLTADQWECLVEEAMRHRIAALLWRLITEGPVARDMPVGIGERLRAEYVGTAFRNAILFRETTQAAAALATESIPVMLLKGVHLARFVYPEPGLRSMADIDIMVPRERLRDAERILVELGYGPLPRPDIDAHCAWSNHLAALEKPGAEVLEVHYDIERPTSPFRIEPEELWERAQPVTLERTPMLVLSREDLLIHLCLHAAYHHRFQRSALKGLIDVATLIEQSGGIDWQGVSDTANRWEAAPFVYSTLRLVREILGVALPESALQGLDHGAEEDAVVEAATRYILSPSVEMPDGWIEVQRSSGRRARLSAFLRGVFPPPARLRQIHGLSAGSPLVWPLYAVRMVDLLVRRGGLLARIVARTRDVGPTFDRERDRLHIDRWAGYQGSPDLTRRPA